MQIPIITESDYGASSIWCADIRAGIRAELARKRYTAVEFDGAALETLDLAAMGFDMTVLIGPSHGFIPHALDTLRRQGIGVVLVSYHLPDDIFVRGLLRIDYAAGVRMLIQHFAACGCSRTALYGSFSDSSADYIKKSEFRALTDGVCFDNPGSLEACWESFRPHAREFDSVLCVNDIAAASLIHRLTEEGIRVPQDIQVACFGSSEISRIFSPSITSVILDNVELGRQTVSIFAYLRKADPSVSVSVRVAGKLVVRESTRPAGVEPALSARHRAQDSAPSFYDDSEVLLFTRLEKLLIACDELDRAILGGQLAGETSELLAERLNLAPETIRYRIRRLTQQIGMDSRADLLEFLREGRFLRMFGADERI
ncbi:MAG: hypothetical protein E7632_07350 [Ruminococcaceae bacterium]|nr:hypothetical protein [Oscillospiraceae bacterium]